MHAPDTKRRMTLPEFAKEAEGVVKIYPATKTAPEMHALRGLDLKIPRGSIFGLLGALKGLRGTTFDPFGRAEVRRVERALIGEYRQQIETALVRLTPITHDTAVALAGLPDEIRGYEQIKLDSVARFREKAKQLTAQLN